MKAIAFTNDDGVDMTLYEQLWGKATYAYQSGNPSATYLSNSQFTNMYVELSQTFDDTDVDTSSSNFEFNKVYYVHFLLQDVLSNKRLYTSAGLVVYEPTTLAQTLDVYYQDGKYT